MESGSCVATCTSEMPVGAVWKNGLIIHNISAAIANSVHDISWKQQTD